MIAFPFFNDTFALNQTKLIRTNIVFLYHLVLFRGVESFTISNSVSINKKNHINIKCLLLNKTLHSVKWEIFSIKLWRKLTKFYPMAIISSYHKSEIPIFRNHIPCPRIQKLILRNKWFNPPVVLDAVLSITRNIYLQWIPLNLTGA